MGIPDAMDKFIIGEIFNSYLEKKEIDHWQISKKYAKEHLGIVLKNNNWKEVGKDVDKVYRKIKARLDKYCIDGIFSKCENGDGESYNMNLDKVTVLKHKTSDGFKYGLWFQN